MTADRWIIVALCVAFAGLAVAVWWLVATDPSPVLANEPHWMRAARLRREHARQHPKWIMAIVYAGALAFFSGCALSVVSVPWNPSHPDPSTGHIYELNQHGSIAYLTRADYYRINGLIVGGWLVGAWTGVIYTVMERRAQRRTRHPANRL